MATAALAHQGGESWAAGMVAGAAVASQPMLLFAVADGTPEHVAVGDPRLLASAGLAIRRRSCHGAARRRGGHPGRLGWSLQRHLRRGVVWPGPRWPGATPHPRPRRGPRPDPGGDARRGRHRRRHPRGAVRRHPQRAGGRRQGPVAADERRDAHTWWQFDFGPDATRDPSLAPTLIPTIPLLGALLLATLRLRRDAVFVLAGLACVVLSYGCNNYLPKELAQWLGAVGTWLGQWVLTINSRVYELPVIDGVRFPRRWLVPASIAFFTAGAAGLGWVFTRLERGLARGRAVTWAVAIALALVVSQVGFRTARMHTSLPLQALPEVSFTRWLAEQPQPGAVITLPQVRPPALRPSRRPPGLRQHRGEPVQRGRAVPAGPARAAGRRLPEPEDPRPDEDQRGSVQAHPQLGRPRAPPDHRQPGAAVGLRRHLEPFRQTLIAWLQRQGLRYVVVDRAMYGTEGFGYLKEQLKPHTVDIQEFEDGDGVVIFVLRD